jgi:UDP-glucuronate decarboxylase
VQALQSKPLTVYGDGKQTRSFCYATDLIRGIVALLEAEPSKELETPVNIGNPGERTVRDLAELILKLTGSSSTIVQEPLPVDDPKVRCPDIRRAQTLLGWKPEFPVERGVALTIEYFKRVLAS